MSMRDAAGRGPSPAAASTDGVGCSHCASGMEPVPAGAKKPVLIIMHGEDSSPGRVGWMLRRMGYPLDCRKPRFGCGLPASLENHSGVVIFGGPMSANDDESYIRSEIDWIKVPLAERKPYLGVCLGAQMLAKHLGARVDKHPDQVVEIGYFEVAPTPAGHAIAPWPERFYQWHREGFELPSGARLLATGGAFPNQAYSYAETAVGVQFHPEITYALVNRWTVDASHRLGLKGAQSRVEHLDGHLRHSREVGAWLAAFLERWVAGRVVV